MKLGLGWISPHLSLYASLPKNVHIWRASLISPQLLSLSNQILTDDEKKVVASMGSCEQQRRFKATRACLRDVLSRYLRHTRPQDVQFRRTVKVALTEVGVDIERRDRPLNNISALLRSRLSRHERMCIQNLSERISPHDREDFIRQEFLKIWTRKEAFVKSTGDGIAKGFPGIEIVQRAATLVVQDISSGVSLSKTGLKDFSPDSAHFGAVALVSDEPYEVQLMQYRAEQLDA